MNEQELFWREQYAKDYRQKNQAFDHDLGVAGWKEMLRKATGIGTILECGSNIGRNIGFLEVCQAEAKRSLIELSPEAFQIATTAHKVEHAFNGSILDSNLPPGYFDLVFTCGVLIHINPDLLIKNIEKMFAYSSKYILIGEYFNRTPVMIEYQGQQNRLFKRDFGRLVLENLSVKLVDYGFLWGYIYDAAGFDDITWWLFQKTGS
jgi:pseudaminic acid biosynthesis-associated methylase